VDIAIHYSTEGPIKKPTLFSNNEGRTLKILRHREHWSLPKVYIYRENLGIAFYYQSQPVRNVCSWSNAIVVYSMPSDGPFVQFVLWKDSPLIDRMKA